jgi:glycosyltransferase involved in cell wall biosynthesis
MKLLCVIPNYWPASQYGGTVAAMHCLNRALAKKGIEITVYTTNVGLEGRVPVNQETDLEGVKVTYFSFTKLFEFMGTLGWQFSRRMAQALKNNLPAFDAVFIVDVWSYPAAGASYYSRMYKKPYILIPSGMLYPDTFFKKIWKKWPYYHLVVKRDLKHATLIQYTSDEEEKKTHPLLGLKGRAAVIPNGINLQEFSDLPGREVLLNSYPYLKDKKIILFLGRLHWIKGLDILLKAYTMVARQSPDVHLLIAGNDESGYGLKVKKWVKQAGMKYVDRPLSASAQHPALADRPVRASAQYPHDASVTFTGILDDREKLVAYAGSDIFVLPSYSENFGMAAIEAMACGIPTIISNKVGIYKEVEQNKAGVVVNTNASDLYQAIKILLESHDLREKIKLNAGRLVKENYDIDKVAEKMIRIYRELGIGR